MGGGDDPSSSSNISTSDELVEQLIEMEKRGYTIPDVSERAELIQKEHDFGHFCNDVLLHATHAAFDCYIFFRLIQL